MLYKLMIKTHAVTKLNYLCITKKDDWKKYKGSGVYWQKHIKKYQGEIYTTLLYESDNYNKFIIMCNFYSMILDVVNSKEFANYVPEIGYGNGVYAYTNFEFWWKHATKTEKEEVYKKRSKSMKEAWRNKSYDDRELIRRNLSISVKARWNSISYDERLKRTKKFRKGARKFFDSKGDKWENWKRNISVSCKKYYTQIDPKVISERNRKQRLNTTEEVALIRKQKIQEVYKTGKHDNLFRRYSRERQGINNPAAKKILWDDIIYTKKDFDLFCKEQKFDKKWVNDELLSKNNNRKKLHKDKIYDKVIMCPHCGKTTNKKPSAFKRWHFDNCKENK